MRPLERTSPAGGRGSDKQTTREYRSARHLLYGKRRSARLPEDWRSRLPDPAAYYSRHVERLSAPNASGWAQGRCPFHDDHDASLSVQLASGGWKCFAGCGSGDLLSFHERLTGRPFKEAVRDLLGLPS